MHASGKTTDDGAHGDFTVTAPGYLLHIEVADLGDVHVQFYLRPGAFQGFLMRDTLRIKNSETYAARAFYTDGTQHEQQARSLFDSMLRHLAAISDGDKRTSEQDKLQGSFMKWLHGELVAIDEIRKT